MPRNEMGLHMTFDKEIERLIKFLEVFGKEWCTALDTEDYELASDIRIKAADKLKTLLNEAEIVGAKQFITELVGKRCTTKDIDDFPDEHLKDQERCFVCSAWEQFDNWASLKGNNK